jgi:acetyltransferase-like isoleucine patch superfamily enzyme
MDLPSLPKNLQFGGESIPIKLGKFVTVGAHSCILPGATIEDKVAFGAYSLIKKQIYKEQKLYAGIPCKEICNRNSSDFDEIKHLYI